MSRESKEGIALSFPSDLLVSTGSEVKIYFTSGFVETGVVESWGETIVLRNDNGVSIIKNGPLIMMVRVLSKLPSLEEIAEESLYKEDAHLKNLESIAELRKRKAEAEREMVRNKLGEMNLSKSYRGNLEYGDQLSILGRKSIPFNTAKENRRRNK